MFLMCIALSNNEGLFLLFDASIHYLVAWQNITYWNKPQVSCFLLLLYVQTNDKSFMFNTAAHF